MNQLGFLESLHVNRHELDLNQNRTPIISEGAKEIVVRFRKLMTRYPAGELEDMEGIPGSRLYYRSL